MNEKQLYEITIYLNGGHTITFTCEEFQFEKNNNTGKYVGCSFDGMKDITVGFSMEDFIAYTAKKISS